MALSRSWCGSPVERQERQFRHIGMDTGRGGRGGEGSARGHPSCPCRLGCSVWACRLCSEAARERGGCAVEAVVWCTRPGYEGAHGHLTRAAASAAALAAAHLHHAAIKPASSAPSHQGVFLAQMLGVESPSASIMTIRAAGESVWPQESSDIWHASAAAPGHVPTTVRVFPACPPSPDPPT